jgi:hypothetical protein
LHLRVAGGQPAACGWCAVGAGELATAFLEPKRLGLVAAVGGVEPHPAEEKRLKLAGVGVKRGLEGSAEVERGSVEVAEIEHQHAAEQRLGFPEGHHQAVAQHGSPGAAE